MNGIKNSKEDRIFNAAAYFALAVFAVMVIYPLYFVVIASFSDPYDVLNGNVYLIPKGITLEGYRRIIRDSSIWTGYANTIFYTVIGTSLNVALTMMIGYPLSRGYFSGKKAITTLLLITMYFRGGLIPQYLLVSNLGLRGTRAIIAVLIMYYGIAHWNDYFRAMIYLNKTEQFPLQLILRSILIQSQSLAGSDNIDLAVESQRMAEQMKYGVIIVSSVPALLLYPFLMKYFEKGVMIGSVIG